VRRLRCERPPPRFSAPLKTQKQEAGSTARQTISQRTQDATKAKKQNNGRHHRRPSLLLPLLLFVFFFLPLCSPCFPTPTSQSISTWSHKNRAFCPFSLLAGLSFFFLFSYTMSLLTQPSSSSPPHKNCVIVSLSFLCSTQKWGLGSSRAFAFIVVCGPMHTLIVYIDSCAIQCRWNAKRPIHKRTLSLSLSLSL
jgi:hypothetical protein